MKDAGFGKVDDLLNDYYELALENNMKEYGIKEFDDFILVYFGPVSANLNY